MQRLERRKQNVTHNQPVRKAATLRFVSPSTCHALVFFILRRDWSLCFFSASWSLRRWSRRGRAEPEAWFKRPTFPELNWTATQGGRIPTNNFTVTTMFFVLFSTLAELVYLIFGWFCFKGMTDHCNSPCLLAILTWESLEKTRLWKLSYRVVRICIFTYLRSCEQLVYARNALFMKSANIYENTAASVWC